MDFTRDHTNQVGFANTGDGMASWLLGQVGGATRITTQNFISSYRDAYSGYFQDDWKVTSKLTINYGIRYELTTPIGEKFGRQAHVDVFGIDHAKPTLVIPKGKDQDAALPPNFVTDYPNIDIERGVASTYLIGFDKTNIAPRLGFAYEAKPGTVVRAGYGIFYGAEENEGGNPNRGENVPFNQQTNFNAIRPSARNPFIGTMADGFPVNSFSLPAPITFRSVYTNRRWPLVHKWNFNIQKDIGWDTVFELAYIGSKGQRLTLNYDGNRAVLDPRPNLNRIGRSPYGHIVGNTDISFTNSMGRSNYHAMTAKLDKRFSDGVQFLMSYTYGHALTDVGSPLSDGPGNRDVHISREYAHASFDVRHRWVLSGLWELPFLRNNNTAVGKILGGWQLNGIATLQTGQYMSVSTNQQVCSCPGTARPDPVSGKDPNAGPRTPEQWFDTSAFMAPAPGTFGMLGNFSNIGPGIKTLDLSLFKDFKINERMKIQFRAESFNLTNTPQFARPNLTHGNSNFGLITGTQVGTNRQSQLALRFMF
jgi:hypothetical protein